MGERNVKVNKRCTHYIEGSKLFMLQSHEASGAIIKMLKENINVNVIGGKRSYFLKQKKIIHLCYKIGNPTYSQLLLIIMPP